MGLPGGLALGELFDVRRRNIPRTFEPALESRCRVCEPLEAIDDDLDINSISLAGRIVKSSDVKEPKEAKDAIESGRTAEGSAAPTISA